LNNNELVAVCKDFAPGGITHDVGLGVFNWVEAGTKAIPIELDGIFRLHTLDDAQLGIIWHSSSRRDDMFRYDALFDVVWRVAASTTQNTTFSMEMPQKKYNNNTFSMDIYLASEVNLGIQYRQSRPIYPVMGFRNTVWYRKMELQKSIDLQIGNESIIRSHAAATKRYTSRNCEEDTIEFSHFLNKTFPGDSFVDIKSVLEAKKGMERDAFELDLCVNFTMYMNNLQTFHVDNSPSV